MDSTNTDDLLLGTIVKQEPVVSSDELQQEPEQSCLEIKPPSELNLLNPFEDTPPKRDDLEGNGLIIVNFWASWCPPCRAEHPTLTALAEAGNPLFGINYRDQPAQALSFLDELGNPYHRIGADPEARNGRDWGVIAMPETFFINDEGVVVLHFRGPIVTRSLMNQIVPALAEAGYELHLPEAQSN